MRGRKQNTVPQHKLTKPCYVLLHRLPQSQLPVPEDKMPDGEGKKVDEKGQTSNHFRPSSRRGRPLTPNASKSHKQENITANETDTKTHRPLTPNASKSHKQENITTNETDTNTHIRRETRLNKQRNKERRDCVASDHTQEPITKVKRDSEMLRWHFNKEETKSVSSEDSIKPDSSKSFFRLGFEVYVREFKKYLYALSEKSNSNVNPLDSELDEELMSLNEDYEYDVNKELVEWIIKSSLNVEVSLEGQWATIKDAIIEAEREVLMEKSDHKKAVKRKAQRNYDFHEQKIQKLPGKEILQINSDEANRNLSKTSTKIHLSEENEFAIKMMDTDQSTSGRETPLSDDLQSTIMMSKNDNTTKNSELKHDETPLQDYDGTANLLHNEDPESEGFVDDTEKLDKIQKPLNESDNIVLYASNQQKSLGTNQTIEKLLEYENSQERSNESGNDADLKNCEQQEELFAKQKNDAVSLLKNDSISNTVVEVSNSSSDKLNTEINTHASKFCTSKNDDTKPDRVTVEDSVVKITLDETSVTKHEASDHRTTLSHVADLLFNQDTGERRDSSLQNVIPAEENALFVNRSANGEVLQLINEIIDNVASEMKTQICFDPPSAFPFSISDILSTQHNAKGNEDSLPVKSVSKKNSPYIDCPTNVEEAVQQLITEIVQKVSLETRKQINCDVNTVISCSATDLESDPDSAEKRLSPLTKSSIFGSTSLLVNSFTDVNESLNTLSATPVLRDRQWIFRSAFPIDFRLKRHQVLPAERKVQRNWHRTRRVKKTPKNTICVAEPTSCSEAQMFSHLSSDEGSDHNTEKQGPLPADVSPHVNSPSVNNPINDEETDELITKIENLLSETKKQTNCEVRTAFSSSTSGLKSDPDSVTALTISLDNLLKDDLSYQSEADEIDRTEEEEILPRYCECSFRYELLGCYFIFNSECQMYKTEMGQSNEEKDNGFKIAPEKEMKALTGKPKCDTKIKKGLKKWAQEKRNILSWQGFETDF